MKKEATFILPEGKMPDGLYRNSCMVIVEGDGDFAKVYCNDVKTPEACRTLRKVGTSGCVLKDGPARMLAVRSWGATVEE